MTIQFRWRQNQSSFNKKMNRLREVWNNMIFILLQEINEKEGRMACAKKEELYFLQYLDKITEYLNILYNIF